jgi:hypothetical protein
MAANAPDRKQSAVAKEDADGASGNPDQGGQLAAGDQRTRGDARQILGDESGDEERERQREHQAFGWSGS